MAASVHRGPPPKPINCSWQPSPTRCPVLEVVFSMRASVGCLGVPSATACIAAGRCGVTGLYTAGPNAAGTTMGPPPAKPFGLSVTLVALFQPAKNLVLVAYSCVSHRDEINVDIAVRPNILHPTDEKVLRTVRASCRLNASNP